MLGSEALSDNYFDSRSDVVVYRRINESKCKHRSKLCNDVTRAALQTLFTKTHI